VFDIGFTELLVIATITLIVIGPERLPETVRGVSMWIGRLKRSLRETRREIEQQIGADDIRRELHNEEVMRSLEKMRTEVSQTLNEEIGQQEQKPAPAQPAISPDAKSGTSKAGDGQQENRGSTVDQLPETPPSGDQSTGTTK
jgi:sec-independent protein translocase protein TatB